MKFKEYIENFDPENDNPDDAPQSYPVGRRGGGDPAMAGINKRDAASRFLQSKGYKSNGEPTPKAQMPSAPVDAVPEVGPKDNPDMRDFIQKLMAAKQGR